MAGGDARERVERVWSALKAMPRSRVYPVLGAVLAQHLTMMQAALLIDEPNYFRAHADRLLDGEAEAR